jgi:hypothetical protein
VNDIDYREECKGSVMQKHVFETQMMMGLVVVVVDGFPPLSNYLL